jgi:OmpA-OmpF porin, OOP family
MKIKFLMMCIVTCAYITGYSQSNKYGLLDNKMVHKVEAANQLMLEKSYFNAIEDFMVVWNGDMQNLYLNHQLATCYYKIRDYKNAVRFYANAIAYDDDDNRKYPYDLFYYAETIKSLGEYENAKVEYVKFYKQKIRTVEFKEFTYYSRQGIKGCDYALEKLKEDTNYFKFKHLEHDINHAYSEFSPTTSGGNLYFASLRQDSVLSYQFGEHPVFPMRIFVSEPLVDTWGEPKEFKEVNIEDAHAANPTFSTDGKTMYFSRCWNTHHNDIYCQIYSTNKNEAGGWEKPHKLHHKINTHSYSSSQPSFVTIPNKKYGDKSFLYFVSNRAGGYGGNDIWFSEIDEKGHPSKPVNCGKKINSSRDEITPFYDVDSSKLYFSSNYLPGFGGFDVFEASGHETRWRTPVNLDLPINSSYDDTYYQPIHNKKDTLSKALIATNRPGGLALKHETCCEDIYSVVQYLPTYIKMNISLTQLVTVVDTIIVKDSVQVEIAKKKVWKFEDKKVLVSRDTIIALEGAKIGLVKKVQADESKKIGRFTPNGLQSKIEWLDTNNLGEYNTQLLQNKEYVLVVLKDSMDPILQEFVTDTDKGFDFKMNKTKKLVKDTVITKELSGTLAQIDENQTLEKNQKFLLENMYFDTDKDKIKDASLPSLELLLEFMEKRPKVIIEIAGHTDSQGNDDYNLDLSQRRAESVKKYLIEHGVKEKRLVSKGYGEREPIASNETIEGRQLNRRTEIVILTAE